MEPQDETQTDRSRNQTSAVLVSAPAPASPQVPAASATTARAGRATGRTGRRPAGRGGNRDLPRHHRAELREDLQSGQSLADVAKGQGKTVAASKTQSSRRELAPRRDNSSPT